MCQLTFIACGALTFTFRRRMTRCKSVMVELGWKGSRSWIRFFWFHQNKITNARLLCLPFVGDLLAREGGGRCHKQLAQRAIADLEIVRLAIAKRQTMVVANSSRSWKNEAKKRFAFRSSSSVGIILGHVEDQRPHLLASPCHRNVPNYSLQSSFYHGSLLCNASGHPSVTWAC